MSYDAELIVELVGKIRALEKDLKSCENSCNRIIAATSKSNEDMAALARDLTLVVMDFLPNIGKFGLQDYGRLNDVLVRSKQAGFE